MKHQFVIFIIIGFLGSPLLLANTNTTRSYLKEYYSNGQLKAEGWLNMQQKTDYWFFYNPNGRLSSKGSFSQNTRNGYWYFYNEDGQLEQEGHLIQNRAQDWWIFYEIDTEKKSKFQYQNDQKHGYGLHYRKNKLIKAEKYHKNQKIGEWATLRDFRRDNPEATF